MIERREPRHSEYMYFDCFRHDPMYFFEYAEDVLCGVSDHTSECDVAVSHRDVLTSSFSVAFWIPSLYGANRLPTKTPVPVTAYELFRIVDGYFIAFLFLRLSRLNYQVIYRNSIVKTEASVEVEELVC